MLFVPMDCREEVSVARAIEQALRRFGRLAFACNPAGVGGDLAPLERASQQAWDGSVYGAAGKAAHHAYVASKHAVIGLTRSVALEYATRGIRVNALCAGVTATPALRQAETALPELVQALVAQHPMGRMASEEEIAGAVLWLCSDAAGYVTGAPIAVDGGFLAA